MKSYNTKRKEQILKALRASSELVSAHDIYTRLTESGAEMNLTTVYRNLDAMTRDGVLMKYSDPNTGAASYKYAGEEGGCLGHLHAKCTECGKLVHLDCSFMHDTLEHAQREHGFFLSCEQTILLGVCAECREERGK